MRGFRSPEIDDPKPPGTLRIAYLGGSTTYCAEVSGEEMAWPHIVTEQIRTRYPDRPVDYVNAGVPGYSTPQSIKNLQSRVASLDPDVIVILDIGPQNCYKSLCLLPNPGETI